MDHRDLMPSPTRSQKRLQRPHPYQFATSRWADHAEQVHAYASVPVDQPTTAATALSEVDDQAALAEDDPSAAAAETASLADEPIAAQSTPLVSIYSIGSQFDEAQVAAVVDGTLSDDIRKEYATAYDQLHEAVFQISSMPPATGTDFTAVVTPGSKLSPPSAHSPSGLGAHAPVAARVQQIPEAPPDTYALLVRSPEPFNDPRLPEAVIARTVQSKGLASVVAPDTGRVFLVDPGGKRIAGGPRELTFDYWGFSSTGTELKSTKSVTIIVPGEQMGSPILGGHAVNIEATTPNPTTTPGDPDSHE